MCLPLRRDARGGANFLAVLLVVAVCPLPAGSEVAEESSLDAPIDSVTIRIDVAASGRPLSGPLIVDLGLGFPFWLHLGRREPTATPPWGTVASEGMTQGTIPAGSSATFTFRAKDVPQADLLRMSPLLLRNVRVSDISRVGLAGRPDGDWVLAGYDLQVNGRVIASAEKLDIRPRDVIDRAAARIVEIDEEYNQHGPELQDLRDLAATELASAEELQTLAQLETKVAELERQRHRWKSLLDGNYPWYVDEKYSSPLRTSLQVRSARVTLVTANHPQASTRNHIYFATGGKRYLLAVPAKLLAAAAGPQTFDLDLDLAPLTTADVRGVSVGMMASPEWYDDAPDRWHPERILVELDGRIVYDSDENPIDRKSLEAIRLIPPAHFNRAGDLVINSSPAAREVALWEAGRAQGLDLASGGPLPLPPVDDPSAPKAEPPEPPGLSDSGGSDGSASDFPPLPGEGGSGGVQPPGDWPNFPGPGPGGGGGLGPPPTGTSSLPDFLRALLRDLLNSLLPFPPGGPSPPGDPAPQGKPPSVTNVAFTSGWKAGEPFNVTWQIGGGSQAQIIDFAVDLYPFLPDAAFPIGPQPLASTTVPPGSNQATLILANVPKEALYVIPRVTVRMKDKTFQSDFGPARLVFPPAVDPVKELTTLVPVFEHHDGTSQKKQSVLPAAGPIVPNRGVWTAARTATNLDFEIDANAPNAAHHIVVLPATNDRSVSVAVWRMIQGRVRFTAHLGAVRRGKPPVKPATRHDVRVTFAVIPINSADPKSPKPPPLVVPPLKPLEAAGVSLSSEPPDPMRKLEQVIDAPGIDKWVSVVICTITISGPDTSPYEPPAIFGARIIPEP